MNRGINTREKSMTGQMNVIVETWAIFVCCRRRLAKRTIACTKSSSVDSAKASTPARLNDCASSVFTLAGRFFEALAELAVVSIHKHLVACLCIFHYEHAHIRKLNFARIPQADGKNLVALVKQIQRAFPARRTNEIRNHEHETASSNRVQSTLEQGGQVCEWGAWQLRLFEQVIGHAQHLDATATGRDHPLDAAVIEYGPHPIAVAGQQPGQGGHEVDQHIPFEALNRAKIYRRAEIKQKPGSDLTVLNILAHVGRIHARGDIPIDVANIILRLIFPQVGEIHPVPIEQGAIIALQESIQAADDLPIEALQDPFRR